MFARGLSRREIQNTLKAKYHVFIREPQIWRYREKHWAPSVRRVEQYAEVFQGIVRALSREGGATLGSFWQQFIGLGLMNPQGQGPALGEGQDLAPDSLTKALKEHSN